MKPKQDIAAAVPVELLDEDQLLHRFGRWAMTRTARRRCGSVEGKYLAPANDDDRAPRELIMAPIDAMRVQKALSRVPEKWRVVLETLYVPKRGSGGRLIPAELWLRILRIPPKLSQQRHIEGLELFRTIHNAMLAKSQSVGIMRAPDTASETPSSQWLARLSPQEVPEVVL